jgi:beta-lactamase class A
LYDWFAVKRGFVRRFLKVTRYARNMTMTRRSALLGLGALQSKPEQLRALESQAGGRLGVCVLDTGTGRRYGHRLDERFAMCSTFKLPLAATVLREADAGRLSLSQWVPYTKADLVPVYPVTSQHVAAGGMTLGALAEAAQTTSDNTAANLQLKLIGGPAGFTRILRSLGDQVTRLDRIEPMMNVVLPGEEHDTTSPRAMAETLARFLTGNALKPASRALLISWMIATSTGAKRIRAGLPAGWRAGDKTGTAVDMPKGMTDQYNDLAIVWPPDRKPLIVTAFFASSRRSVEMRDEDQAVLAAVGKIVSQP